MNRQISNSRGRAARWTGAALVTVLALAAGNVVAEPAASTPEGVVAHATDRMLAALRAEGDAVRDDPDRLGALVESIVEPYMDFQAIAGRVLGKHWQSASPGQRERFIEEFRTLLMRTYGTALTAYAGVTPRYEPARMSADGKAAAVRAQIPQGAAGPAIALEYRLHRDGDSWKGYDIAIDGISLVVNYRSSFAQEVRSHGLDGLIKRISDRNRALGNG